MASEEPHPGRCNATTRDGDYCEKYPAEGSTRCRLHGGASTGPRNPDRLEGNDHAAGNPGGGAPELNCNAMTHGARCDLDRLEARLDPAGHHRVAGLTNAIQKRLNDDEDETREKARELALRLIQEDHVHVWNAEADRPTLAPSLHVGNKIETLGSELGLWKRE